MYAYDTKIDFILMCSLQKKNSNNSCSINRLRIRRRCSRRNQTLSVIRIRVQLNNHVASWKQ